MFNYHIKKVFFQNIRNFDSYSLDIQSGKSLILIGDNGIGKTSILEAISLIYGRGIRGAKYDEITRCHPGQTRESLLMGRHTSYSGRNDRREVKRSGVQLSGIQHHNLPNDYEVKYKVIHNNSQRIDNINDCNDDKVNTQTTRRMTDIYNNSDNKNWFSSIILSDGSYNNTIIAEYKNGKKTIRINEKIAKNFNNVFEYIRMFWMTQEDYHNFLLSASYRRKFLDRMIIQIIPNYYDYLTQYQHYISERSKVLATGGYLDDIWLSELERKIAKLNILIKKSRDEVISEFNDFIPSEDGESWKFFPKIKISGLLEERNFSEEEVFHFLKQNRGLHARIKRMNLGVHLSKVNLFDYNKDLSIDFFSSGEQRLLLNKFIINFTKMQSEKKSFKPILLLDDILTFFDEKNQNLLVEELLKLETQFFITTNNMKLRDDVLSRLCVKTFQE